MKTDYNEAIGLLVNEINTVGTEQVSLDEMYGRILAENITAKENVPSFSRSPYDGYAFRSPDTAGVSVSNPVTLKVIDNIKAGDVSDKKVEPGTAVRLMTGAALPEGADAICKYEDTEFDDESVTLTSEFRPFENVIQPGEDIKEAADAVRGRQACHRKEDPALAHCFHELPPLIRSPPRPAPVRSGSLPGSSAVISFVSVL